VGATATVIDTATATGSPTSHSHSRSIDTGGIDSALDLINNRAIGAIGALDESGGGIYKAPRESDAAAELAAATDAARQLADQVAYLESRLRAADAEHVAVAQALRGRMAAAHTVEARIAAGDDELAAMLLDTARQLATEREARLVAEYRGRHLCVMLRTEQLARAALHNTVEDLRGRIRVVCRIRPDSSAIAANATTSVSASMSVSASVSAAGGGGGVTRHRVEQANANTVTLHTASGARPFRYHAVLGPAAGQAEAFETVAPLVRSALDGFNVSVIAYGQTGAGKTYSMATGSPTNRCS
jgi:kinesin family protein C1